MGETVTYSDLASAGGCAPSRSRRRDEQGRNPVSIIIPCHRVVGKKGDMGGFAGGLERKQYLLQHEMDGLK